MTTVAILGASSKPDRYSHKAQQMLGEYGHTAIPVSQREAAVLGTPAVQHLSEIREPVDTVTVYINPGHLQAVADELERLQPRRVIFNPGSEAPEIMQRLQARGVEVEAACTLVLLRTGQF